MMGVQAAWAHCFTTSTLTTTSLPITCCAALTGISTSRVSGRLLKPFYSGIGRPSIDPALMIRMLMVGYCMGIRSERRLCEGVHLNLARRWFRRLGLDGKVPYHSTFSKNRHGRFRESDLLRHVFDGLGDLTLSPRRWAFSAICAANEWRLIFQ